MKIAAVSDIHGFDITDKIPKVDILLIAGDISPVNMSHGFVTQKMWFESIFVSMLNALKRKAKHIVFIAGNHDTFLSETNISKRNITIKKLMPRRVHYLCDEMVTINGIRIYGSPWCNKPVWGAKGPPVWNFADEELILGNTYNHIPNDIDILITHGPAYGFCDMILDPFIVAENRIKYHSEPEYLGSKSLRSRILDGMKVKYVLSGHIHSAKRNLIEYRAEMETAKIQFACVSILDESYGFNPDYKPLVFDYE